MTSQLEMAVYAHFNYSVSADVQFIHKTINVLCVWVNYCRSDKIDLMVVPYLGNGLAQSKKRKKRKIKII